MRLLKVHWEVIEIRSSVYSIFTLKEKGFSQLNSEKLTLQYIIISPLHISSCSRARSTDLLPNLLWVALRKYLQQKHWLRVIIWNLSILARPLYTEEYFWHEFMQRTELIVKPGKNWMVLSINHLLFLFLLSCELVTIPTGCITYHVISLH